MVAGSSPLRLPGVDHRQNLGDGVLGGGRTTKELALEFQKI